ncbi:hypothetical protein OC842_001472 [Tilletia horrida]|uniref:Uncharacterized protein n=1 Tax=Tilletia horrida TaxID=155126 RepID=A0AAN6JMI1_9BASI|nr:hypothetical protein OC842_001472 [Tilletia horrida]
MPANRLLHLKELPPINGNNPNTKVTRAPRGKKTTKSPATTAKKKAPTKKTTKTQSKKTNSPAVPTGLVAAASDSESSDNEAATQAAAGPPQPQLQPPSGPVPLTSMPNFMTCSAPNGQRMSRIDHDDEWLPANLVETIPLQLNARGAIEIYAQICRHLDPEYWQAVLDHLRVLQDNSRAGMEALSRFAEIAYFRVRALYTLMCTRYDDELRQWANCNAADHLSTQDLEQSRRQLQPQFRELHSPAKPHPPTVCITPATPNTHAIPLSLSFSSDPSPDDGRFTAIVGTTKRAKSKSKKTIPTPNRQLQLQASEQIALGVLNDPPQPHTPVKTTSEYRRRALPVELTMVNQALYHADATRELSYEHDPFQPPMHVAGPSTQPMPSQIQVQTFLPFQIPFQQQVPFQQQMPPQQRIVSMPHPQQHFPTSFDWMPTILPRSLSVPQAITMGNPVVREPMRPYFADGSTVWTGESSMPLFDASQTVSAEAPTIAPASAMPSPKKTARKVTKTAGSRVAKTRKAPSKGKGKAKADTPSPAAADISADTAADADSEIAHLDAEAATPSKTTSAPNPASHQDPDRNANASQATAQTVHPIPSYPSRPGVTFAGLAYPWPKGDSPAFAGAPTDSSADRTQEREPGSTHMHVDDQQPHVQPQVPTGIYLTRMAVIHGLPFDLVASDPFRIYILILHLLRQLGLAHLSHTVRLISTLSALPSTSSFFYGGPRGQSAVAAQHASGSKETDIGWDAASASQAGKRGWAWIIFNSTQQRNLFLHTYLEKVRGGWVPPSVDSSPGSPVKKNSSGREAKEPKDDGWPYFIYSAEDYLSMPGGGVQSAQHGAFASGLQPSGAIVREPGLMLPPPVPTHYGNLSSGHHFHGEAQAQAQGSQATSSRQPMMLSNAKTVPMSSQRNAGGTQVMGVRVPAYSTFPPLVPSGTSTLASVPTNAPLTSVPTNAPLTSGLIGTKRKRQESDTTVAGTAGGTSKLTMMMPAASTLAQFAAQRRRSTSANTHAHAHVYDRPAAHMYAHVKRRAVRTPSTSVLLRPGSAQAALSASAGEATTASTTNFPSLTLPAPAPLQAGALYAQPGGWQPYGHAHQGHSYAYPAHAHFSTGHLRAGSANAANTGASSSSFAAVDGGNGQAHTYGDSGSSGSTWWASSSSDLGPSNASRMTSAAAATPTPPTSAAASHPSFSVPTLDPTPGLRLYSNVPPEASSSGASAGGGGGTVRFRMPSASSIFSSIPASSFTSGAEQHGMSVRPSAAVGQNHAAGGSFPSMTFSNDGHSSAGPAGQVYTQAFVATSPRPTHAASPSASTVAAAAASGPGPSFAALPAPLPAMIIPSTGNDGSTAQSQTHIEHQHQHAQHTYYNRQDVAPLEMNLDGGGGGGSRRDGAGAAGVSSSSTSTETGMSLGGAASTPPAAVSSDTYTVPNPAASASPFHSLLGPIETRVQDSYIRSSSAALATAAAAAADAGAGMAMGMGVPIAASTAGFEVVVEGHQEEDSAEEGARIPSPGPGVGDGMPMSSSVVETARAAAVIAVATASAAGHGSGDGGLHGAISRPSSALGGGGGGGGAGPAPLPPVSPELYEGTPRSVTQQ